MPAPKIISISRRGDIPAFQTSWLIKRLREGYCHFQAPYGGKIQLVSLKPEDCDGLVFWTRNPSPLFKYIDELKERGYCFYFHFTITGYPKLLESHAPPLLKSIERFITLSEKIGPEAVHWRYDPVILSSLTPESFHSKNFSFIAKKLKGSTGICTASFVQFYEKSRNNFKKITERPGPQPNGLPPVAQTLCISHSKKKNQTATKKLSQKKKNSQVSNKEQQGVKFDEPSQERKIKLAKTLNEIAAENGIKLRSCCDSSLLSAGISKGSCVGPEYLSLIRTDLYNNWKKRPTRKECACFESVDIGTYETCTFGCCYCYATRGRESALRHLKNYDQDDSILIRPQRFKDIDLSSITF